MRSIIYHQEINCVSTKELKEEIEAKTFGRTYVPAPAYGTSYHDILLKKLYG